jgi:hypothetical protein
VDQVLMLGFIGFPVVVGSDQMATRVASYWKSHS